MSERDAKPTFAQRHLDPASRLGEILFGLIMVLGATLTAGLTVAEGEKGVRELLKAALGCNVAWGIIDGVMYVMNCVTERSGKARLIQEIQRASDSKAALAVIRDEIEPDLEPLAESRDRETLYQAILEHLRHRKPARISTTAEDFCGALACCWLVIVSCL
ncbi:MAG TPA: VIT family protein, partial [Verrucomicrobiae bacterium]|nr:VIT family protein [Verrucomicrobiae bacterium]